jgi:hypothetical protein
MIKHKILLAVTSLSLAYLVGWSSYNYALKFISYPQTKAASKHSSTSRPPYLTKKERDEYKIYLMEQATETSFMLFGEWKLSKVFKKTITQLEKEDKNLNN